jgi:hypothetical protein
MYFRQAGVEGMQGRRRVRGGKEAGAQWGLSRADGRSRPEGGWGVVEDWAAHLVAANAATEPVPAGNRALSPAPRKLK